MQPTVTLEQVLKSAFKDGDEKIKNGIFIHENSDFDFDNQENYKGGDPENIHTLISLYSQELTDEQDIQDFENSMRTRYKDFCSQ